LNAGRRSEKGGGGDWEGGSGDLRAEGLWGTFMDRYGGSTLAGKNLAEEEGSGISKLKNIQWMKILWRSLLNVRKKSVSATKGTWGGGLAREISSRGLLKGKSRKRVGRGGLRGKGEGVGSGRDLLVLDASGFSSMSFGGDSGFPGRG